MGVSKQQREKVAAICKCGCGETFYPFPVYRPKSEGGGLRYPKYIRAHGPTNRKNQFGVVPTWNKGLTKEVCPTLTRMGFQPGHEPYTDWTHVNKKLRTDKKLRQRWLAAKRGQVAWNTGLKKADYKHGFKSGAEHGNWRGNHGGVRDLAVFRELRLEVFKRDKWTCQQCGDHNHKGRGKRISLHMHHVAAIKEAPLLALDPNNCTTLCEPCHIKTENYGTKLLRKRRKQSGK